MAAREEPDDAAHGGLEPRREADGPVIDFRADLNHEDGERVDGARTSREQHKEAARALLGIVAGLDWRPPRHATLAAGSLDRTVRTFQDGLPRDFTQSDNECVVLFHLVDGYYLNVE